MKLCALLTAVGSLTIAMLYLSPAPANAFGPLRALLHRSHSDSSFDAESDGYGYFFNHLSCNKAVRAESRGSHRESTSIAPNYTASYGSSPLQTLDVYAPSKRENSSLPIIVMVHGGAWCVGDKRMDKVVTHKAKRWVSKGFLFVSVDYRMLPQHADIMTQAADVASAIAYVQAHAAQWGGNPAEVIVMGHSAGAHLVSLLNSDPQLAAQYGAHPWLGTISLDSAALDVPMSMHAQHPVFYDDAFGSDPSVWLAASPFQHLSRRSLPWLGVCSSQRKDSCPHAHAYAKRAQQLGVKASVLEEDMKHAEVNDRLGEDPSYTDAVESFMASLSADIAHHLK
ncbi:MAG TPA: alpha/beta hydrolase [Rickettsiales bacterium]|nr:alpha/beta hydrolase [Rickettsiales bacterium]